MRLENLPKEILIIIIRQLDFKSILNLYNTCSYIRSIVTMPGVVKECSFSLNTLATVHSLKSDFFKDISRHLLELDMCGVNNLSKTSMLPAMRKLKSLQTLNIAYTIITMIDFLDIYNMCPTIKNITIDFTFDKIISQEMIARFQTIFQNFENVHFVGIQVILIESGLSQLILKDAKLNSLMFTKSPRSMINTFRKYEAATNLVYKCNHFRMYWTGDFLEACPTNPIRHMLYSGHFEFIVVVALESNRISVYASETFKTFLYHNFGISAESPGKKCFLNYPRNYAILVWDKETTNFDEHFFSNLLPLVKDFFPCNYPSFENNMVIETKQRSNWFYISPTFKEENKSSVKEPMFKKRRVVPQNVVLNYDEMLKEKQNARLYLAFNNNFRNPVTLQSDCNYLQKLTYLSLTGSVIYSSTFFNILFRCCNKLVTLNVEAPSLSSCTAAISRSIPLSQSIQNLRLVDKRINFKTLFSSFSQCKTLENIHILDVSHERSDIADPTTMFKKCDNLYNLFIYAHMSNSTATAFSKAKFKCGKYHLNIELTCTQLQSDFYDCFTKVFQLNPIKL